MLKIFVEEAAALASITLFVGMIAVWAQIFPSSDAAAARIGEKPDSGRAWRVPRGHVAGALTIASRVACGPASPAEHRFQFQGSLRQPCPTPDSSISTSIRPIRC